jgi:hypothetical protein
MVGEAVAATVIGDYPEMPGEIVDLGLPKPGMGDRVCGQEHDCLGAGPKYLVIEP